jgi:hypothetical protein
MIRPLVTHTAPENNLQLKTVSTFTVTCYTITVQFKVLWNVTWCCLVIRQQCFGRTCCLYHSSSPNMETAVSKEPAISINPLV